MSELVLTSQNTPAGIGANMIALFANADGRPAYTGQDGAAKALVDANNPAIVSNVTAVVGNVTMNVPSGRVNIGSGQTILQVTNSLVNANTRVFAQPAQLDSTGRVNSVVSANGSFNINCTAPAANMAINFLLFN